jgi:hypothetical protein
MSDDPDLVEGRFKADKEDEEADEEAPEEEDEEDDKSKIERILSNWDGA